MRKPPKLSRSFALSLLVVLLNCELIFFFGFTIFVIYFLHLQVVSPMPRFPSFQTSRSRQNQPPKLSREVQIFAKLCFENLVKHALKLPWWDETLQVRSNDNYESKDTKFKLEVTRGSGTRPQKGHIWRFLRFFRFFPHFSKTVRLNCLKMERGKVYQRINSTLNFCWPWSSSSLDSQGAGIFQNEQTRDLGVC